MQITFDTHNPDDVKQIKALAEALTPHPTIVNDAPPRPAPAKKAQTSLPSPRQPVAEPVPDVALAFNEEPETEDSAEATQADAVKLATDLVAAGHATVVKFALRQLGVERVSKLADEDIAKFVTALTADFDETKAAAEQEG
jgi:hypothetical protein